MDFISDYHGFTLSRLSFVSYSVGEGFEGFSLETARSMVALMDVSFFIFR